MHSRVRREGAENVMARQGDSLSNKVSVAIMVRMCTRSKTWHRIRTCTFDPHCDANGEVKCYSQIPMCKPHPRRGAFGHKV